jgi:hypothetical protein
MLLLSIPYYPTGNDNALNIRVSRNGTNSGINYCIPCPKDIPKSIPITSPV